MKHFYLVAALAFLSANVLANDATEQRKPRKEHDHLRTVWIVGGGDDSLEVRAAKNRAWELHAHHARKEHRHTGIPNFIISDKSNRATFGIGGFVAFRTYYDFNNVVDNKDFYPSDIPMLRTLDNKQKFGMDVSSTRLFLRTLIQTGKRGPIEAYVESDFRGGDNLLKIRQAYISFMGLTLGQATSTFADMGAMPATIDYEGPHSFAYIRNMMIQYRKELGKHWEVALALEMPSVSANPYDQAHVISQRVPDIPLYVQYHWNNKQSHVRASGILRNMVYANDLTQHTHYETGWGVQLSSSIKVSPTVRLFGQVAYGNGIQNYIQDMNDRGADLVADPHKPGHYLALPVLAWYAGAQFNFARDWQINAAYSQINTWNRNDNLRVHGEAPVYRVSQYIVGNVFYRITPALNVGAEYLYGTRKNVGTNYKTANRIQMQVQLNF